MQNKIQQSIKPPFTRREFLGTAAAGTLAAANFIPAKSMAQSDKLKFGLIGCGWYGGVIAKAAFKTGGVECIALCDVDSEHLNDTKEKMNEQQGFYPKTFKDYRELLQVKELQAVFIATPPHWHALPFLAALDRGLDIYCEKPLAYDIREGQTMVDAAERSTRIVQIGFQRRKGATIQKAREFIQSGNLGRVIQVDVQIHYDAPMRDATPQDPPPSLDWDAWCGPAPVLPYSPNIGHFAWRLEKQYGNGHLVDWGIHMLDATRWILDETMPISVQAFGGIYKLQDQITTPDTLTVNFEYKSCPVTWRHRLWGAKEYTPEINNGILFFGEKGTLFVSDRRNVFIPAEKDAERQTVEEGTDMAFELMQDFLTAVKTRHQPLVSPREGFYSTATTQLGMIAYETQQKIRWDLKTLEISDNPKAAGLLKRQYRAPWEHPYQA
ncbi:Gfo/Idh/MocA family oxidoreductase [candidate division KSB1 bacterium]|nr:Gfo/Idh/MocA family oxidoreductase [candidate division KSB1 bacterium]